MQSAETTAKEWFELHVASAVNPAAQLPFGVPNEAKSTAVMCKPCGHPIFAFVFSAASTHDAGDAGGGGGGGGGDGVGGPDGTDRIERTGTIDQSNFGSILG